jgi:serine/threonine protein kinase/tetratricopeptide (TPR) repeat protein
MACTVAVVESSVHEPPSSPSLNRPLQLGRYHLLRLLGAGAMGEVYEAYDPVLARKIAIKVIRRALDAQLAHDELVRAKALLVRESKALAKLAHANVVPIYDVGESNDGSIYLAMELVIGASLRTCFERQTKRRQHLIDWVLQAGRGLAAAHAAGLIHRDFKPENIVVGNDGLVRVLDFGLALVNESRTRADESQREGAASGTPAYMAPEQALGATGSEKSDIFSFACVFYEAWCGRRPFVSAPFAVRKAAIETEEISWPSDMPRWLQEALRSALAADPAHRWTDLNSMIAAISGGLLRRQRRRRLLLQGTAMVALALTPLGIYFSAPSTVDPCREDEKRFDPQWSAEQLADLERSFSAAHTRNGEQIANFVVEDIHLLRNHWQERAKELCAIDHHDALPIRLNLRQRMDAAACLQEIRAQVATLLDIWRAPSHEQVLSARHALSRITAPIKCLDPDYLDQRAPLPVDPGAREKALELHSILSEVRVRTDHGDRVRARSQLEDQRAAFLATKHAPLLAEFFWSLGRLAERSAGATENRLPPLLTATLWEIAGDRPALLASSLQYRWFIEVYHLDRREHEEELLRHQRAVVSRGGDSPELLAGLTRNQGIAASLKGDIKTARRYFEASLAQSIAAAGENSDPVSAALYDLAFLCSMAGDLDAAQVHLQRSIAILVHLFGESHPDTLATRDLLGLVYLRAGKLQQAVGMHQEALRDCLADADDERACAEGYLHAAQSFERAFYDGAATDAYLKVMELERQLGRRIEPTTPYAESALAEILHRRGDEDGARVLANLGLARLEQETSAPSSVRAQALLIAIEVHLAEASAEQIRTMFANAKALIDQRGEAHEMLAVRLEALLASRAEQKKQWLQAAAHYERALARAREDHLGPQLQYEILSRWAQSLRMIDEHEFADQVWHQATDFAQEIEGVDDSFFIEFSGKSF